MNWRQPWRPIDFSGQVAVGHLLTGISLPWEPTSFIFWGYNPYFGCKIFMFHGFGVQGYTVQMIYGCKSKCEVRINPQNPHAIQTPDPDQRSRPIQTSRSRPIQTSRSRPIQTYDPDPFALCWLDIFFFKVVTSIILCTTKYYSSTTLYYKVLLCTTKYDAGWSREFWKNLAIPFQTSFQTVPDPFQTSSMESKRSVHSRPCCPRRKNRSVHPAQNHLIQFKSYMKWLSWFQALRSRRAEKTLYESGRSRRPDHRGTIQTRLSTHAHMCWTCLNLLIRILRRFTNNIYTV